MKSSYVSLKIKSNYAFEFLGVFEKGETKQVSLILILLNCLTNHGSYQSNVEQRNSNSY